MLKNKSQKLREKDSWIKAGMNEFRKHGKYNKKLILDTQFYEKKVSKSVKVAHFINKTYIYYI